MDKLAAFNQYRHLLFSIAYRMLSSCTDAEDVLQEAWIRWQSTDALVRSPKSFLSTLTTRLCIDHLKSARVRREQYVGTWLPEPLIGQPANSPDTAELTESLTFAFLTLLDALSPIERAVFLLREVFDFPYADIATTTGKSIANCRQIAHRARQQIQQTRPTAQLSRQAQSDKVTQFLSSWYQHDLQSLIALMAEDATFWSDGGGEVTAARHPLHGNQKIARFLIALHRSRLIPPLTSSLVQINYQPGLLNSVNNIPQSTFSFGFTNQRIQSIFSVVNPQKLEKIQRF